MDVQGSDLHKRSAAGRISGCGNLNEPPKGGQLLVAVGVSDKKLGRRGGVEAVGAIFRTTRVHARGELGDE